MHLTEIGRRDGQHAAFRLGDWQEHCPGNPQFAPLRCGIPGAQQRYGTVLFSLFGFRFGTESADRLRPLVGAAQTLQVLVMNRRLAPDEFHRVLGTRADRAAEGSLARGLVIRST